MDPMFDFVRDRTLDLRRSADAARRDRALRGTIQPAEPRSVAASTPATPVSPATLAAAEAGACERCAPADAAQAA